MKIGYILKKFPRLSETFILNEILALEDCGIEVEVFSLKRPDDEPLHPALERLRANVTYIDTLERGSVFKQLEALSKSEGGDDRYLFSQLVGRLDLSRPWRVDALRYAVPIFAMLEGKEIQHLHSHFATIATAVAHEVSMLSDLPYSFTMHAKDIYRETVSFENLSCWIQDAAFGVTVCEANKKWIVEQCGNEISDHVRKLYNGIDLDHWNPAKAETHGSKVVAIGRLVEKKGFDDYLRACSVLIKKGFEIDAKLVGSGEMESELHNLADKLGLNNVLEFCGPLPQDEVCSLLAEAAVLVAPCVEASDGNRDALPTVLLEAMAMGVPCVTTPIGGIPEIVRSSEEGWLVPSRDSQALARAIEGAVVDSEGTRQRGIKARQRIEENFDLRKNTAQLVSWFEGSIRNANLSIEVETAGMGNQI